MSDTSYLSHFGLKESPFRNSPDVRFLYLSEQVNETLQQCLYMIDNAVGPLYIYGPIGTGKTTLANRLQQQLEQQDGQYIVAYLLVPPQTSLNALLRLIMDEFKFPVARSYTASLQRFAAWLIDQHKQGVKPVLILDEAHYLTPTNLKLIHFLLNYETQREKLLQLALFGQNQLAQRIDRFPELKSRMYPAALTALNRQDVEAMIRFRWFVAGGDELPFDTEVVDELFRATLGMPRDTVKLCDMCLLRAALTGRKKVHREDVTSQAKLLRITPDE